MGNPKDQGQDPVAGPPSFPKGEQVSAASQSHASPPTHQEYTPEALQGAGMTKAQADAVHDAVGAGVPWLTILAVLAQRLGPVAVDVVKELVNSFSFGKGPGGKGK